LGFFFEGEVFHLLSVIGETDENLVVPFVAAVLHLLEGLLNDPDAVRVLELHKPAQIRSTLLHNDVFREQGFQGGVTDFVELELDLGLEVLVEEGIVLREVCDLGKDQQVQLVVDAELHAQLKA